MSVPKVRRQRMIQVKEFSADTTVKDSDLADKINSWLKNFVHETHGSKLMIRDIKYCVDGFDHYALIMYEVISIGGIK